MIERQHEARHVTRLLRDHRVVGIIGARQIGKTTLARQISQRWKGSTTHFDLEDPEDIVRLSDPLLALRDLRGLIVIDEVQRFPDIFPILRVLADRSRAPARFLILGSASPHLLRQSSESLAGRIAYHELKGFSIQEVGIKELKRLWLRGSFPRAFLARSNRVSLEWRKEFLRAFLERDVPQFGIQIPAAALRRFWAMLAHYHGQIWNASEFARSFGASDTTVRRYLDLLSSLFVVRLLPPFHENLRKRQVKSPKVYIADTGLLHTLLDIADLRDLERHPKLGASWESHALETVIRQTGVQSEQCYFWATHSGAELDLLITRGQYRWGIEFKHSSAPAVTRSMRNAIENLRLRRLDVVHAGDHTFPLADRIQAVALSRIQADLLPPPGLR